MSPTRIERIVETALRPSAPGGRGVSNEVPLTDATEKKGMVKRVAIGSDHGGFKLKAFLSRRLADAGYFVTDAGTFSEEACDYPDFAEKVARLVAAGDCERGIMIDTFGTASAMAANKVRGVRASVCWDTATARSSREHNNANVLALGGKSHSEQLAAEIAEVWLTTEFAGGRHWRRVNKVMEIERRSRRFQG
jgi:ribose 5-phosphate isomerase B